LCLLLGINTRYENSHLNIKLRQRNFKGNFRILVIGSFFNFTFSILYLGTNFLILKNIIEGNHALCQDFKISENSMLITNTEIFKRNDSNSLINLVKILKTINIVNKIWNGINILNATMTEVGTNYLSIFSFLNLKDFLSFNSFYLINVILKNIKNFKRLVESKLLKFVFSNSILIEQNSQKFNNNYKNNNLIFNFKKYIYLPNNTFFENNETFFNTEGIIKRTTKFIVKPQTKNNWELIRKISKKMNNINYNFDNIIFNTKNVYSFKNYVSFHFYATQNFTDLNFYLNVNNFSFVIYKKFLIFKNIASKIFSTKVKYWLDDFFIGGKDNFCYDNSFILLTCSINIRKQSTNFF
jgi:hypothetical protein